MFRPLQLKIRVQTPFFVVFRILLCSGISNYKCVWLANTAFTLVSYHALAWFGKTHLSNHHGINTHTTKPSQAKPAHRKLLCWHGLVWLGFLYSSQAINTKAEMVKRSIIKNARVYQFIAGVPNLCH